MGRLTSAVHWWEESQLRVLVLGSLVAQFLLYIFIYLRIRAIIPGWIKFLTWLAYLGGDAIAIYALAMLFNRQKQEDQGCGGGGGTLEVVWAPILLLHLGGNDGITAYNIEDNELWTRHLLIAVSQVTVAVYVFCKSWPWPGDDMKLLLASAVMLFIPGILKCFAKPWDLRRASIKSLFSLPAARRTRKQKQVIKHLEEAVQVQPATTTTSNVKPEGADDEQTQGGARAAVEDGVNNPAHPTPGGSGAPGCIPTIIQGCRRRGRQRERDAPPQGKQNEGETDTLEQYVEAAMAFAIEGKHGEEKDGDMDMDREAYNLFVDLPTPYPLRLTIFKHCWDLSHERVEKILRLWLPWPPIVLFHFSHKEAYSGVDVKITYALFCCTAVLELCSILFSILVTGNGKKEWPGMMAQYNLIGYFARDKNHSNKMWIASKSGCKDFVDQHWCMESCSSGTIVELVIEYLKEGWQEKIHDPVSYHKFNDNRGQWALEGNEDELSWSIKGPFDESVVLWHMATELCFSDAQMEGDAPAAQKKKCATCIAIQRKAIQCRQMSNYMMYLLFVNPEMLLPGTRRNLFTTAYNDLKYILKDNKLMNPQSSSQQLEENALMGTLMETMQDKSRKQDPNNFIDDAWNLAQELLKLGDEKMWKVIQGVWVEMLCFSASRCRGYLHAKALGSGGEFLSYVWLLMFYMGMETFTERMQREREELPSQEANENDALPPFDDNDTASSSTSRIPSSRASSSTSHQHNGASTSSSEIEIVDF